MPPDSKTLGFSGEDAAKTRYEKDGYKVFGRNMRFGRIGELDLVLIRDGAPFVYCGIKYKGIVVFCEVKTRRCRRYGSPAEAVNAAKIRRIRTMAQIVLENNLGLSEYLARFDVAEVIPSENKNGEFFVNILENAF